MAKKKIAGPTADAKAFTNDSYSNFEAAVGLNTQNLSNAGTYSFDYIAKNRIILEAMYRTSWIVGQACDAIADDMTQSGIQITSENDPDEVAILQEAMHDLKIWRALNANIKWSRLYGTCCAIMLIDGQDLATPFRLDSVGKDQFKGLLTVDRWSLIPSFDDLIGQRTGEFSPDMGLPRFYTMLPDSILPNLGKIHYTRILRFDAILLPHNQQMQENLWSESIVERMHDRILAFDSTTQGAAQLVYKAYLRRWYVEGLKNIVSSGGSALRGLQRSIKLVAKTETNEGITIIDSNDKIETTNYTFSGLDSVLLQFGQQLSGAMEIPLVRLFGQEPTGLNSTGEATLRTYYLNIKKKQETQLRQPIKKILEVISRSVLGKPLPPGFAFEFNNLWQLNEVEKADIAQKNQITVQGAYDAGIISQQAAMKELVQMSHITGVFSNITDEDIKAAEEDIPTAEDLMQQETALKESEALGKTAKDHWLADSFEELRTEAEVRARIEFHKNAKTICERSKSLEMAREHEDIIRVLLNRLKVIKFGE